MNFYKKLLQKLQDNQIVYLLTVVENIGSSPGRQGFKMFISQDETISGSIGGGIMEYQFVEKVKKDLKTNHLEILFKRQIHQGATSKESSGMICSGEQTVVFHPLNKKDINTIQTIVDSLKQNNTGVLEINSDGISFKKDTIDKQYQFQNNKAWSFKELIGFKETFYIVGAGHVGLATSQILHYLNFHVVIFDNRLNLNTLNENSFVQKKHIINYSEIGKYIKPNSFVAIMTSKYIDDKLILSKLLDKKHRYLGVLGSKSKMKTMFDSFINEGISIEKLNKVLTPIGLPIKSQTPEEIAISIAAQVIAIKNKLL